jgi:TRAP-type transport system periplasmic protein
MGEDRMGRYPALALLGAFQFATQAHAQEVTLRRVTAFAEKTTYSRGFEAFIERVNEAGKGLIRINYIGGPKAMPPFEVGNALKNGVVEIANVTGAFYTNLLPRRTRGS